MSSSQSESKQTWREIFPGTAWCVEGLLDEEECAQLKDMAVRQDGILEKTMQGDTRHRQRVTSRLDAPELSQAIWQRIQDNIPQEIVLTDTNFEQFKGLLASPDIPEDYYGTWKPSGLTSNRVNVAYCSGKGHLAAHRDADHVWNEHERSFLTINGYLTNRPVGSGGATRFLVDDIRVEGSDIPINEEKHVLARVESDKAGKAVVFFHGLMHDGEPLASDDEPKWIYRALVYYRRDPETAPKLSQEAQEARKVLKEAVAAEEAGQIGLAIQLYKKAYRLDPSLDR
ncbi:Inherit from NOG: P4Hc [Seminavis robusta]|uniref:Inherit from NOG: P4Hc n=1 Tax=Seminavis robusta TaxID=568900 RepID=A0A9N8E8C4_9STRA|nr:Inherit from NOG: P4Hc [Seminavis robusta]|eukprot:Sro606_g174420.1 Inherit from NOG: P4Hc (285) ;mRNA; f:4908-5762